MTSIESLISVTTSLALGISAVQNTSNLLVLSSSAVINLAERYRTYSSSSNVGTDFGVNGVEYAAASAWFGQSPQPTTLLIGRWANTDAPGQLIGGYVVNSVAPFTGIADGGFQISVDGVSKEVDGINFEGQTTLNGIAQVIQTAMGNVTVIWNATYTRFEFTSNTTGTASSIGFMAAPATVGTTDLSRLLAGISTSGALSVPGQVAETASAAANVFDSTYGNLFYALCIPEAADADHFAVASFIQSTTRKHLYGITSANPACLDLTSTQDLLALLSAASLSKTILQYSTTSSVAICSAIATLLTVDYGGSNTILTLAWTSQPGITPENLTDSQFAAIEAKNGNVLVELDNGDSAFYFGTMASTSAFADDIVGADNMTVDCTQAIYDGLRSTKRIAQSDAGMQYLVSLVTSVCQKYVVNGFLATGAWTGPLFGALTANETIPGFYVYAAPVFSQSQAARNARIAVPIQVAGKLGGAIHKASIAITLNP